MPRRCKLMTYGRFRSLLATIWILFAILTSMDPPEALTGQRVVRTGSQGWMDSRSHLGSCQLLNLVTLSAATASGRLPSHDEACSSSLRPIRRWYCAQAIPGQVLLAYNGLVSQRLNCFVPLYRGRTGQVELMFGTYFFVGFDLQYDTWEHITHTPGVLQLLSLSSATPSPLPLGSVEDLIERTGLNGVVGERQIKNSASTRSKTPAARFRISDLLGRPLRVKDGPFTSFCCVGISSTKNRIRVLLDIFGRTSEADLRFDQLELAE